VRAPRWERMFQDRMSGCEPRPFPGQKEIEREELSGLFGRLVGARVRLLPLGVAVIGWLIAIEPARWRRTLLAAVVVTISSVFVLEWLRYRRRGLAPAAITQNLAGAILGVTAIIFASGGIESPFLYVQIPLGILSALFIRAPGQYLVPVFQLASLAVMAWIGASGAIPDFNPASFGGGPRLGQDASHLWWHAGILAFVLVVTQGVGRAVRRSFESILRRRLAAQQESLRAHAERAEELTALSGEIAHELKNPLASVKGLAGLLAQGVPEGKAAERLAVLRREVDRMQVILDEFLNFSRPLVPLALGENDVGALVREVAALHEGMSRERGVGLELRVPEAPIPVRCDPRKVQQILINLVQNALDASPAGAAVEIEAAPARGRGARLRVLDRGRGLDASLADAVFSPGVTTKPSGSGLGLTIARSLARQHGGDLTLGPRPGGGTVAELTLPAAELGDGRAA